MDAGELPELRKGAKRGARGSESGERLEGKSEDGGFAGSGLLLIGHASDPAYV